MLEFSWWSIIHGGEEGGGGPEKPSGMWNKRSIKLKANVWLIGWQGRCQCVLNESIMTSSVWGEVAATKSTWKWSGSYSLKLPFIGVCQVWLSHLQLLLCFTCLYSTDFLIDLESHEKLSSIRVPACHCKSQNTLRGPDLFLEKVPNWGTNYHPGLFDYSWQLLNSLASNSPGCSSAVL